MTSLEHCEHPVLDDDDPRRAPVNFCVLCGKHVDLDAMQQAKRDTDNQAILNNRFACDCGGIWYLRLWPLGRDNGPEPYLFVEQDERVVQCADPQCARRYRWDRAVGCWIQLAGLPWQG